MWTVKKGKERYHKVFEKVSKFVRCWSTFRTGYWQNWNVVAKTFPQIFPISIPGLIEGTFVFSLMGFSLMFIKQVWNFPLAYHALKTVKILDCPVITLTHTQVKNFMTTWRPFVTIWIPLSRYLISVPGLPFASRPSSIRDISGCSSPTEQNQ